MQTNCGFTGERKEIRGDSAKRKNNQHEKEKQKKKEIKEHELKQRLKKK